MNPNPARSALAGLIAAVVCLLGLAAPAQAAAHAVVKNPYVAQGVSWVDVPDAERVWLQSSRDTIVGSGGFFDDEAFGYLAAGSSCTMNNGDTLTGPALVALSSDANCAKATSGGVDRTPIPIGFEINFGGVRHDALFVNSNGAIGFGPTNIYDKSLHYSSFNARTSGISVLGMDTGIVQAGTGTAVGGSNLWVAQTTVDGKQAFVVSWENLRSYGNRELTTSAQLVLMNDGDGDFTAWFNFDDFKISDQGYDSGAFFTDLRNNPSPGVYRAYNVSLLGVAGVPDENGCVAVWGTTHDKFGAFRDSPDYLRVIDAANNLVSFYTSCGATDVLWEPAADDRYVMSSYVRQATYMGHYAAPIGWAVYETMEDGTLEWNATEFQYNRDIRTLLNTGSDPLINQSLNTTVPGRYVIGMRGGKTWGDPGLTQDQAELALEGGTLVFDGHTTATLAATGGSGTGELTYELVSGPCVIEGDQLLAVGLGDCLVKAVKAGDSAYNTATSNTATFVVERAPLDPVTPGEEILTENGRQIDATITKTEDSKGVEVDSEGLSMYLEGKSKSGANTGVEGDSTLVLEQDGLAELSGHGFQAESEVKLFLHSPALLLGSVMVNAEGAFTGSVTIPASVAVGAYRLQAVGYTPSGEVRVVNINVKVQAPPALDVKVKAKRVVRFAANSWALNVGAKATLRALARTLSRSSANIIVIKGSYQFDGSTANGKRLATNRAKAVAAYLRTLGVKGSVSLGTSKASASAKSRKAVIMANYGG